MKRFLDVFLAILTLIVFSPLILIIIIILKCTGEHSVFYSQDRAGVGGKPFRLVKFNTMLKNSQFLGSGHITLQHDPRVLPFGGFLRKTKLDEIPQLFNIIKGDMSIIGPRPVTMQIYTYYTDKKKKNISLVRPGLSGVGSIFFRDEQTLMEQSGLQYEDYYKIYIAPSKGEMESWYAQHHNLWLDIKLVLLTSIVLFYPPFDSLRFLPEMPQEIKDNALELKRIAVNDVAAKNKKSE